MSRDSYWYLDWGCSQKCYACAALTDKCPHSVMHLKDIGGDGRLYFTKDRLLQPNILVADRVNAMTDMDALEERIRKLEEEVGRLREVLERWNP